MLIILSQKIDTASEYADEAFKTYHYPATYRNQIHEGDTYVYYQGNRYVKEQRYYFGVGTIVNIYTADGENYYATLHNGRKFDKKVPIYLPDGKYVEQLGYNTVRRSPTPPWQSSIRPLSQQAYDYFISESGIHEAKRLSSVDELKENLKNSIWAFFLEDQNDAIVQIKNIASEIIDASGISEASSFEHISAIEQPKGSQEKVQLFIQYCETTHLTYSYKPVLLLAFFECANDQGIMSMAEGIKWVGRYYRNRREQDLVIEKKKSIYQKPNVSDDEIRQNLIVNPIKALTSSGYFIFNQDKQELILLPELWPFIGAEEKTTIAKICKNRLEQYYGS